MRKSADCTRRPGRFTRKVTFLGIALALVLMAAGCGSASRTDSGAATTASTASGAGSGTSSGAATTAAAGAKPTGAPIKVMTEAPVDSQVAPYPNIKAAAEIYTKWVNDHGGIAGRPLELTFCDDRADASEAANCARKAVDQGVIANVGSFTIDMSRAIPIMEEGKVAWFGACCPIVAQENTSAISFPMGCVACFNPAAAIKMVQDGCKNIVQVYGDLPVADVFAKLFSNGYASTGADPSKLKVVKIPIAPGDYSSQAAQTDNPDCLFANISEINWPPLITAMNGVGATPRYYGPQGNLDSVVAKQFPTETDGAVVINVYPNIAAPVWNDYRGALKTYNAPDLDWNSLAGLGTWAAYTAFKQVVESIKGDITHESFLAAAGAATKIDTGGMVGVLDFTKPWAGGGGQFPRIFNRTVFFDTIGKGELKPLGTDGSPQDMTKPFDGTAN